jgi:hypothetical protein
MSKSIASLRRRRVTLRWTVPPFDAGVGADTSGGTEGPRPADRESVRPASVTEVVNEAVRVRARATRVRAERLLRSLGVQVVRQRAGRRLEVAAREARP